MGHLIAEMDACRTGLTHLDWCGNDLCDVRNLSDLIKMLSTLEEVDLGLSVCDPYTCEASNLYTDTHLGRQVHNIISE